MFKAALSGQWVESVTSLADGLRHMDAEEWDPKALFVVVSILYLRIELLSKIALIVDYYQIHGAVSVMTSQWLQKSRGQPVLERNVLHWLCVAWVFKDAVIFKEAASRAIRICIGSMESEQFAILGKVTDKINERLLYIRCHIIFEMNTLANSYLNGGSGCYGACRTMNFGTLVMTMASLGIPWQPGSTELDVSFPCDTFASLEVCLDEFGSMAAPTLYDPPPRTSILRPGSSVSRYHGPVPSPHHCTNPHEESLVDAVREIVTKIEAAIVGLDWRPSRCHSTWGRTSLSWMLRARRFAVASFADSIGILEGLDHRVR
ncbi:hypothetical protein OQA88_192 [Cercophora sp. LCS_1]